MRTRTSRRLFTMLALAGMFAFAACAENAPQDTLEPAGRYAQQAYDLFIPVFVVAAVIFFLVEGMLIFAVLRYRRRSDRDAPVQVHGNTPLEILWTIIPAAILAAIAVPTVKAIFDFARPPGEGRLEITVKGHRWWWEFDYPVEEVLTANEMHIPVGRPVFLTLESPEVIHSFWIPKLAGKQDVVPGRKNTMTVFAEEPGRYLGQCAEYCGISHANMRLVVIAESPEDFARWVAGQQQPAVEPGDALAATGKDLFENGVFAGGNSCAGCHAVAGTKAQGRVGPNLTHFASRATFAGSTLQFPDDLADWLRDPPELKPGSIMPDLNLTEDQVEALVAYLRTLQ